MDSDYVTENLNEMDVVRTTLLGKKRRSFRRSGGGIHYQRVLTKSGERVFLSEEGRLDVGEYRFQTIRETWIVP